MRTIRSSLVVATIVCLVIALLPAHATPPLLPGPTGAASADVVGEGVASPGPDEAPAEDVEAARAALATLLAENGVDAADAEAFAEQLTDEDLLHFAAHPDHVNAAGAVPEYIWILLGIFLGVLILAAIF